MHCVRIVPALYKIMVLGRSMYSRGLEVHDLSPQIYQSNDDVANKETCDQRGRYAIWPSAS